MTIAINNDSINYYYRLVEMQEFYDYTIYYTVLIAIVCASNITTNTVGWFISGCRLNVATKNSSQLSK